MLKSLLEYTNLFSPNENKNNNKMKLKYFQQNLNRLECIVLFATEQKFKKTKISYAFKKTLSFSIFYSKCHHEYEKIFKEENSIEILKILGLSNNIKKYKKMYNHA